MKRHISPDKRSNAGFALLFVLFLVAVVLIGASVAVLRVETQGKRDKEAEMIWRGEQYERAIGLYYRKFGRFPTSLEDLVKGTNGVRYLREAYRDPMNKDDGAWRLIYVTPAGQLIGSVRYITLQQMALVDRARIMGMQLGQGAGGGNGPDNSSSAPSGTDEQNQNPSPPGAPPGAGGSSGAASQSQPGQQANGSPAVTPGQPASSGLMQQPVPPGGQIQEAESSDQQVIGGFIVGVASKINRPSLKVYNGGTTYKQWEFIYNPLEQVQTFGGTPISIGAPTPGQPQAPPIPQPPQPQNPMGPGTP